MPATFPLGPGGEPVTDSFYFVHQPLTGNGSITVRVTSLTGLLPPPNGSQGPGPGDTQPGLMPWAKAGIIIKQNLNQGSAYAAMMVTGGHGVRMQWNYTADTARPARRRQSGGSALAAADPVRRRDHRLRLGGRHALDYGRHRDAVRPAVDRAGRAVRRLARLHGQSSQNFGGGTSQHGGGPTQATGVFDHVTRTGGSGRRTVGPARMSARPTRPASAATTRPAASSP